MRWLTLAVLVLACGCSRTTVLGSADGGSLKTALTLTGTVCTTGTFVLRALFVEPLTATRERDGWKADTDGDGLSDARETSQGAIESADRDRDGFSDGFEVTNAAQGFEAEIRDSRGCDPAAGCTPTDDDADGVTQTEEAFVGSDPQRVDSDGDGLPDGLELRYRLPPAVPNTGDTDGDTVSDLSEVAFATDPVTPDDPIASPLRFETRWTLSHETPTQRCYDVVLDNLPMTAPEGKATLFKLWKAEGPSTGPRAQDVWAVACAQALRSTDGTTLPADLNLSGLDDAHFSAPALLPSPRATPDRCLVPEGWVQP